MMTTTVGGKVKFSRKTVGAYVTPPPKKRTLSRKQRALKNRKYAHLQLRRTTHDKLRLLARKQGISLITLLEALVQAEIDRNPLPTWATEQSDENAL